MKNKVWIIPSLVAFVLLISSKDISSQDLKDKVVVHTPNGKVTIISDNALKTCAGIIQGSLEEELERRGVEPLMKDANCNGPRPGCIICCHGREVLYCSKKPESKCCQTYNCPDEVRPDEVSDE
jgi:hypothetical protein